MSDNTGQTVSVTVELPAAAAMRIATAICARRGYGPTSPEDAVEFVKRAVFDLLRSETLEYEAGLAAQAARDAVYANPDDPLAAALFTPVVPEPEPAEPEWPAGPEGPTGPVDPEPGPTGSTAFLGAIR